MRISDWSSDVCSSDLEVCFLPMLSLAAGRIGRLHCRRVCLIGSAKKETAHEDPRRRCVRSEEAAGDRRARPRRPERSEERVEGTRVSERVDLGGSGIIKNNKRCHNRQSMTDYT